MKATNRVGVGVVGTGWMASAHTEALRRLGIDIVGVVGRNPQRSTEAADIFGLPRAYPDYHAMLRDPAVTVVHITTPNDVHASQAMAALQAGKHVVCEKPLGLSSSETSQLRATADRLRLVNAVSFNLRHYPQVQNAAGLVASGAIGTPRLLSGAYHQDWLLLDTDWNWRLDQNQQGSLQAVADIGSHWIDMAEFVTGARIQEVFADLHNFVPTRQRPDKSVATFATSQVPQDTPRTAQDTTSDDAASLLLRMSDGTRGMCSISQVAAGRKNRLTWELNGSSSSLAWSSESPEMLWYGHRDRPNEHLPKDESMTGLGRAAAAYPAGATEGYPDTFRAMFQQVYRDVSAGRPSDTPTYPTFADGHRVMLVCEAVQRSATTGRWQPIEAPRPG